MYFTNGDHRAFESLMRDKPGDHYDSGADGPFPECRSCRCHRPYRKDRYCKYAECPYTPGRVTAINKGQGKPYDSPAQQWGEPIKNEKKIPS